MGEEVWRRNDRQVCISQIRRTLASAGADADRWVSNMFCFLVPAAEPVSSAIVHVSCTFTNYGTATRGLRWTFARAHGVCASSQTAGFRAADLSTPSGAVAPFDESGDASGSQVRQQQSWHQPAVSGTPWVSQRLTSFWKTEGDSPHRTIVGASFASCWVG